MTRRIHISMPVADIFGAGACGKHLLRELAMRYDVLYDPGPGASPPMDEETAAMAADHYAPLTADVHHPLIQFSGPDMEQVTAWRGNPNVAYIFSEREFLTEQQRRNLAAFNTLIAGSEWNAGVIRAAGFDCFAVQQGVDRAVFRNQPRVAMRDKFVIYSGGKLEHRKGQDLVIRAVKALQERHDDVVLVASWFNIWNEQDPYREARRQGLRLVGLPLLSQPELAVYMNQTDVGVFPNRCEGGTNLMLMDYAACSRPVVAANTTGQRDVLSDQYAVLCEAKTDNDTVEELVEGVEYLYQNAAARSRMGKAAGDAMDKWPWSRTADGIERAIWGKEQCRAAA